MTYQIAIPTYNRAHVVASKTLAMLQRASIPAERIHLFVADEAEAASYLEEVQSNLYGSIVVGVLGIANQRQYMRKYFAENTCVVSIDDDVTSVDILTGVCAESKGYCTQIAD